MEDYKANQTVYFNNYDLNSIFKILYQQIVYIWRLSKRKSSLGTALEYRNGQKYVTSSNLKEENVMSYL